MISHDNLTWTAGVCAHLYQLTYEDHMISYLPLSHIAAQMMVGIRACIPFKESQWKLFLYCCRYFQDIHAPLHTGLTIHFAQPDALKGSLAQTLKVSQLMCYFRFTLCDYHMPSTPLQEVRPTAFVAVPRVWEKFKEKVETQVNDATGLKGFMVEKARVRSSGRVGISAHTCTCSSKGQNG